ncbi:capsid protein [Clostridium perfringens]|uniref:capsid protein n=1 Tax=Clostridium perfringens TaxID=1502 RepID=UPI0013E3D2E9|nr:capsid protein [Clostridium perfringens]NGT65171.1 capsid protein [Clostridium perfringens]
MAVNYATQYAKELANAYPYVLYSGRLWSTDNSKKYKVVDAKTIKIPRLSTTGRVDGDRTKIGDFSQNFSNDWETKELKNHRIWQTLVHPQDVNQTNQVASITNITQTMNETQKFPELDAMMFSTLYTLKNAKTAITAETAELTSKTALAKFDAMMDAMDEGLVPPTGRILYVDTFTKTLLDNAVAIVRTNGDKTLSRSVSRLDEVDIVGVPTTLMKTGYIFNDGKTSGQENGGITAKEDAEDMAMILVHPSAILPIVSYSFAQLQDPSALTQGKYVYFEESFEDVFILDKRVAAIQVCVKKKSE